VALVQANMSLLGKRLDPEESRQRHLSLTRGAMQGKPVDLVVWSETSIGGAVDERAANTHYANQVGRELPVPTIFGAVLTRPVADARKYSLSNSALVTDERGSVVGRYDKQFLLGFGEYLPLGETFPILYKWSPNSGRFSPGESFEPLPVGDHEVATFICYEDIIPSFVNRIMSHGSPELLVNLTNDAWFGDTTQPWVHLALSKLRAVEQRRFFVRSTNSGVSAFVDPVGRTLASTPTFSEIAIAEDLRWMKLSTPYRVLGDIPWWLVAMVSVGFAFLPRPAGWAWAHWRVQPAAPRSHPTPSTPPLAPASAAERSAAAPTNTGPEAEQAPDATPSTASAEAPAAPDALRAAIPVVRPGEFGAFPKPPSREPETE
jgi:apolipoprotein N-acyltransferase